MKCSGLGHTFPGGIGFTIPFSSQQVDSIQIMNVYECNGKNIFMRRQPSGMENFIFHRMKIFLPLHS